MACLARGPTCAPSSASSGRGFPPRLIARGDRLWKPAPRALHAPLPGWPVPTRLLAAADRQRTGSGSPALHAPAGWPVLTRSATRLRIQKARVPAICTCGMLIRLTFFTGLPHVNLVFHICGSVKMQCARIALVFSSHYSQTIGSLINSFFRPQSAGNFSCSVE